MRSQIQDALLSALEAILRPTIKLLLQSGIGYSEFESFVAVFRNERFEWQNGDSFYRRIS